MIPIILQEYVKAISSTGMQSNYGFEGQVNACWTHRMTSKELETIRSAGFPVFVIHGRLALTPNLAVSFLPIVHNNQMCSLWHMGVAIIKH